MQNEQKNRENNHLLFRIIVHLGDSFGWNTALKVSTLKLTITTKTIRQFGVQTNY